MSGGRDRRVPPLTKSFYNYIDPTLDLTTQYGE